MHFFRQDNSNCRSSTIFFFHFVITILLLHSSRYACSRVSLLSSFAKELRTKNLEMNRNPFFIKIFLFLYNTCVFTRNSWRNHAYDNLSFCNTSCENMDKDKLFTSWPFMASPRIKTLKSFLATTTFKKRQLR